MNVNERDAGGLECLGQPPLERGFGEWPPRCAVAMREKCLIERRGVDGKMIGERGLRVRETVLLGPINTLALRRGLCSWRENVGLLKTVPVATSLILERLTWTAGSNEVRVLTVNSPPREVDQNRVVRQLHTAASRGFVRSN